MKKILFAIIVLSLLPQGSAINLPPPSFFIAADGSPNVLIVTGENAASEDIVSASLIASRIGQMAVRAEERTFSQTASVKRSVYAFWPSAIVPSPYLDADASYFFSPLYFPPSPFPDPYRYNQIVLTPAHLPTLHYFDLNFVDYHGNDDGRFSYFETHEEIILRFYDALHCDPLSGFIMFDSVVDLLGGDFLGELEAAQPPVLVSPATGAAGICPQTNLTFDWSDSVGAIPIAYRIQLDDDPFFMSPEFDQSLLAASTFTYTGTLTAGTLYFWRVRAQNEYGLSAWSVVSSFTSGACAWVPPTPPPPLLLPPFLLPPTPPPVRVYPSITYRVAPIYLPRYLVASSRDVRESYEVDATEEYYAIPAPDIFFSRMMPRLYFFDREYYVIDAGEAYKSVVKGEYDTTVRSNYLVYGVPYYYTEQYAYVGHPRVYNNFTIRVDDVDLDHNKAKVTITEPSLYSHTFWMVLKPLHGFSPSPQLGSQTGEPSTQDWNGDYLHDVYALVNADIVQEEDQFYTIAGTDITGKNNMIVYFLMDGIAVFHGSQYDGLLFNLYVLEDWGRFYDMRCCFPYTEIPDRYSLDVFRAGTVQFPDLSTYDVWGMDVSLCDDLLYDLCDTTLSIAGPEDYFGITFEDMAFEEEDTDDLFFTIEKSLPLRMVYTTTPVAFHPSSIVRLDSEVSEEELETRNLILVGGPASNGITRRLVSEGKSRIDWHHSDGEWEFIANPFAMGRDVLIVGGRDRKATRAAALELVRRLG